MQADRVEQKEKNHANESIEGDKKNKKPNKNSSKPITLEEQVVFSLVLSIHKFSSKVQRNEIKEKEQVQRVQLKLLQRNGIKRSDINEIVYAKIKPIPFSSMNDIKMKLRASLAQIYLKQKPSQTKLHQSDKYTSPEQLFEQSINAYVLLAVLLKEASIPTPIQEGFYHEYNAVWQRMIENVVKPNQQSEQLVHKHKQRLLQIWRQIPHQSLTTHLSTFNLTSHYSQLHQSIMIPELSSLLVDNKIQQCCTYYEIYFLAKYPNVIPSKQIKIFQEEVLTPKITKSQHIFSPHVLSLFKSNPQLKQHLLNSHHLDPAVGVRIIDLLKEDGKKYPNIQLYCLKQHYKSIIYDHKYWWIVEDKLSFNNKFVEWYTEDLIKAINGTQQNDKLQKIANQIKNVANVQDLQLSLLLRNKIINLEDQKLKDTKFTQMPNPLYEKDRFDCSELIIQEIAPEQIEESNTKYLKFEEFGVVQKDIKIIDKIDEQFEAMCEYLLKNKGKPIGFDTQFRCVSTKYEQQGVALIQLSTETNHYIIDFLKLENQPQFNKFLVELLCNEKYIKIGHTISSDIKYLTYTLHLPQTMSIQSFVDISQIFKTLNPNQKFSSLSFLCLKFLNRKLSKYEQRSNWNRRPLRKAQIHYAALDAFSCVLVYNKLIPEYRELLKHGKRYKAKIAAQSFNSTKPTEMEEKQILQKQLIQQKQTSEEISQKSNNPKEQIMNPLGVNNFIGDIHRSENLVYHKKFENILSEHQPKFLVDNMLKKLSSIMRNCGIDAQYIAVRDYQLASAIAQKEGRIILTRDTKFFQRKDNKLPIYMIKEKTDSEKMFEEVAHFFKIDLSLFTTLSRCVKCNGPELIIIDTEQAMVEIKFKYHDSTVKQFWRCTKCKQIYWQGGQFQRAKQKYTNIKKL